MTNTTVGLANINLLTKAQFNSIEALNANELYAVEANDLCMPSDSYVDLTLAPSGSTYTAPANGYIYIAKSSGASGKYISVGIKDVSGLSVIEDYNVLSSTTQNLTILFPISKGAKYVVNYNATGTTSSFRFIYAQGEI